LQIEQRIRAVLPDLTKIASLEDITRNRSQRSNDPVQVLVVAPPGDSGYFERILAVASRHRDQVFLVLISDEISATDYKRLVRTGAEWVSAPSAPHEILDILAKRRSGGAAPVSGTAGRPVVVAFVPSAGGVGNATLVSEIGVLLKAGKATRDRRV